jgi:hypothetical protein
MIRDFNFHERLDWSKGSRLGSVTETIANMLDGCATVRESTRDEERVGVDYVATLRGGAIVLIDEKRRDEGASKFWRHGQPELALEVWSVVPTDSQKGVAGWTLSEQKQTDLVLFTFADIPDCYLLPFQPLRVAFRRKFAEWRAIFRTADQCTEGRYYSRSIFVPIDLVTDAIVEVTKDEPSRNEQGVLSLWPG